MSKVVAITSATIPVLGTGTTQIVELAPVGITRDGIGRWSYAYPTPADSVAPIVASVTVSMKPNGVSTVDQTGRCSITAIVPLFSKTLVSGNGSTPATDKYAYALVGMLRYQDGQVVTPKGVETAKVQGYASTDFLAMATRVARLHPASAMGEVLYG